MWSLVPYFGGLLLTGVFSLMWMYFFRPSLLAKALVRIWRLKCGMQVKFIGDENFVFCYGERGQKSKDKTSILMIHGFTGSKDQWNASFKDLPKEHHLIAMDLPGHGGTSTPPDSQTVDFEYTLGIIRKFVDLVELTDKPFHLIGASLGGCLVGLFAATYPELVERVTMICPAMRCPEESDFAKQVEAAIEMGAENVEMEHCQLLPQTPRELQLMVDSCTYSKTQINKQIMKGFMNLRGAYNPYYLKVFRALATEENVSLLENTCHKITMPSQVIWGEHDQIVHSSGAKILESKLPNCQEITILERCGHSVDIDRPYATSKAIDRFHRMAKC